MSLQVQIAFFFFVVRLVYCMFLVKKADRTMNHQEFQVPKMEVLNLIRLCWGVGFPLSLTYSLCRYSYLQFRYLKCFVNEQLRVGYLRWIVIT